MKKITVFIAVLLFAVSCSAPAGQTSSDGIPSDEGMFPFTISYTGENNATSISSIVDAPAGKYGFLRVEDGHFVNDRGRVRLNATNLTGGANFPTHEQAERLAARMARFGINCVRLHYMDCEYRPSEIFELPFEPCIFAKDGSERNLDPEMLDRLDYMISQFKANGIYVDVNLYVARYKYHMNGKTAVNPEFQQKEREYARDLLTHVNPYTGMSMANDPCVAVIELNNEESLICYYNMGRTKFPEWPSIQEVRDSTFSPVKKRELLHVLEKYESEHWNGMLSFLKKDLGVKCPVTSTQVTYSMPSTFEGMDYYDVHGYWQHPSTTYWRAHNIAMINDPDGGTLTDMASRRYAGKPFTVSEYNHPYPAFYGAEGQPMLHAYAAFQGWDGVFAYSWSNRMNEESLSQDYFFSLSARTDVLAHFIACAAMYLRGDVQESPESITPVVPFKAFEDDWTEKPSAAGNVIKLISDCTSGTISRQSMLLHKTFVDLHGTNKVDFPKENIGAVKMSDTKQIEWNNENPEKGMFIVRTPNVKLFSGFPEGRNINLGDGVSFKVGQTKLGWTTMSLTSLEGGGFGAGSTSLLAATGYTHNKDAVFTADKDENGHPTDYISSRFIKEWGSAPVMTEGINAVISLPSAAEVTSCWVLDGSGNRITEVPVTSSTDGRATISISSKYRTIWYEIAVSL